MEIIYPKLALYGSKNECTRTDTIFLHLSAVSEGTVSLKEYWHPVINNYQYENVRTKIG